MVMYNRGQHEIAGFVLIVLIVSIIGVIFLSISLGNQEVKNVSSLEVSNLLEASMYHTTDCAISYIPQYRTIQDLIKDCNKDKSGNFRECLDGRDVCLELEDNLKLIVDQSLDVGEGSVNKAYKVDIFLTGEAENEGILSFSEGVFEDCISVIGGSHSIPLGSFSFGRIDTELTVCKG